MKLFNKLETLINNISQYLSEMKRVSMMLSENVPNLKEDNVSQQIQNHITEIMIHLQRDDIIRQEIEHIHSNLLKNSELFKATDEELKEDNELYTVVNFILIVTRKQLIRVNENIEDLIEKIEIELFNIIKKLSRDDDRDSVENYLDELLIFKHIRKGIKESIHLLNRMKEDTGYKLNINECRYKDTVIKEMIDTMTVEDERITILKEFPELDIESATGNSITLF